MHFIKRQLKNSAQVAYLDRRVTTEEGLPLTVITIQRVFGMGFVPYKDMIRMPQYSFLVGRPYFLPAAWIYRGWLTIRKKGMKNTTQCIQDSFVSKEAVEEQKAYIEKWNQ